jgi:ketol-acid reductoisomerase
MKVFYDEDVTTNILEGKTIAVIGYGSQGRGQSLNMHDSGLNVVMGLREGGSSWKKAEADGLTVKTIEEAGEWERIETTVDGLFVVKPPENNNKQMVFVELVPTIKGQAIKKKGIYLKNSEDLEAYIELLNNPKTKELVDVISEYYGKRKTPKIEI